MENVIKNDFIKSVINHILNEIILDGLERSNNYVQ